MSYTHTFEVQVGLMPKLQGEIDFTIPGNGIKTDLPQVEITNVKAQKMLNLIKQVCDTCKACGEIIKIEIVKKP